MAEHPAGEGIHTVEISKTTASILVGVAVVASGGFASSYFDMARSVDVLGTEVARISVELKESFGNCCTKESCQWVRETLDRLRNDQQQHREDAERWKQRIVMCEIKADNCVACRLEFGLKSKGGNK